MYPRKIIIDNEQNLQVGKEIIPRPVKIGFMLFELKYEILSSTFFKFVILLFLSGVQRNVEILCVLSHKSYVINK